MTGPMSMENFEVPKVPQSTQKYLKVSKSTQKYLKVPKSTSKYPKIPQSLVLSGLVHFRTVWNSLEHSELVMDGWMGLDCYP